MKRLLVLFLIITGCNVLSAQTDRNKAMEEFRRNRQQEFQDWRTKANKEFSDHLSKAWESFHISRGKEDPIGPVPDKPEIIKPESNIPRPSENVHNTQMPIPHVKEAPVALDAEIFSTTKSLDLDYFGIKLSVPIDPKLKLGKLEAKEKEVANAWQLLSETNYKETLDAVEKIKKEYSLNDWATYNLIKQVTETIYPADAINQRIMTQMFLLCHLKYRVRVGSADKDLVLLLPFKEQIYQVSYIDDKDESFYIFGYSKIGGNTSLYTFTQDFSLSENLLSLTINEPMNFGNKTDFKKINLTRWVSILGEEIEIPISIPYVSFALDYPQSDLITYHRSAVNTQTARAVINRVRVKILEMNEYEAVSYILNLVQNGFDYKTDYEMFGRPKPLFIEESLYYGANNCKDRVLLFSWLIKNTLGLNTIMFGFPNHVAAGVEFKNSTEVEGDTFQHNGSKYVMCDPTFINAPVGATMTKFKGVNPQFIDL